MLTKSSFYDITRNLYSNVDDQEETWAFDNSPVCEILNDCRHIGASVH